MKVFVLLLCSVGGSSSFGTLRNLDDISIPKIITDLGFPVETHKVQTEDGYILEMHRISHGLGMSDSDDVRKPVVLLMHGLLAPSECWLLTGRERGLAYLLADRGYDVWMGNARGNRHSRKHARLNPDRNKQFWQFSFHEIGMYDLPAKINYILDHTSQKDLIYIGHSQGTTAFYVMAAERPEYNSKIRLMISLAPVAYMSNIRSPIIRIMAKHLPLLEHIFMLFDINEVLPGNRLMLMVNSILCQDTIFFRELCANILFLIAGYDSEQLNRMALSKSAAIIFGFKICPMAAQGPLEPANRK